MAALDHFQSGNLPGNCGFAWRIWWSVIQMLISRPILSVHAPDPILFKSQNFGANATILTSVFEQVQFRLYILMTYIDFELRKALQTKMTKLGLIIENLLAKGGSNLETSLHKVQGRCIHY